MRKAEAGGEDRNKYIGLEYPPVPDGIIIEGGWTIEEKDSSTLTEYSIGSVIEGDKKFLWLEHFISLNEEGEPSFKLVDILPLPPIDSEKEDVLGGSPYLCHINGEYDPTLIVIAKLEDSNTEFLTNIQKAWRVDLAKEKFKEIETVGVEFRCENMGFGL
ncbi:MAG: hypothetical protein AB4368_00305 [Xenococcaceae cyanobacterium]